MIYDQLAEIYDELMSHVPYAEWSEYIQRVVLHCDGSQQSCLEAACGTGAFLAHFAAGCDEAAGFDLSPRMLAVARQRFRHSDLPVKLEVADLREWRGRQNYDLALCLYDSINYMLSSSDLKRALASLASALREEGLLIFDISTIHNARHNFHGLEEEETIGEITYSRRARWSDRERILYNDFLLQPADGGGTVRERHLQRLYTIDEVTAAIKACELEPLAVLDGFTFRNADKQSCRIHFVARRNR